MNKVHHRLDRVSALLLLVSVLKIDKDCYVDLDWVRDWIRLAVLPICRSFGLQVTSVRMTESRKGLHFYIGINPPIRAELANRLHWILGDDARRVDFNRARIRAGYARWNKMFEAANARVVVLYSRFWPEQEETRAKDEEIVPRKRGASRRTASCKVAAATLQLPTRGDPRP